MERECKTFHLSHHADSSIPFSTTIAPSAFEAPHHPAYHHAHPAVAAISKVAVMGKHVEGATCHKHKGLLSHVEFALLR